MFVRPSRLTVSPFPMSPSRPPSPTFRVGPQTLTQPISTMRRYIQKDCRLPHYRCFVYNISQQVMSDARRSLAASPRDLLSGRKQLKRKSFIFDVLDHRKKRFPAVTAPKPGFVDVLYCMVQTGQAVFCPTFILPSGNRHMDAPSTASLVKMWEAPQDVSRSDVMNVLFGPTSYEFRDDIKVEQRPIQPVGDRISLSQSEDEQPKRDPHGPIRSNTPGLLEAAYDDMTASDLYDLGDELASTLGVQQPDAAPPPAGNITFLGLGRAQHFLGDPDELPAAALAAALQDSAQAAYAAATGATNEPEVDTAEVEDLQNTPPEGLTTAVNNLIGALSP